MNLLPSGAMKALVMTFVIISMSTAFSRKASFLLLSSRNTHRIASTSTLSPLQLFPQIESAQSRRRFTSSTKNHVRSPITSLKFSTEKNCCGGKSLSATTDELKPFTWSDIIDLFIDLNDDNSNHNNYIPSNHPNLALFRRSECVQESYETHKHYLSNNWKSPYDYLVYSKFGEEFGFEKELTPTPVVDLDEEKQSWNSINNAALITSPEGYRYQCKPSLTQACDYNIQNGVTYLKLVLNDFPYDMEDGIQHWCLWKIGGQSHTEGILMEEMQWALHELNTFPDNGNGVDCHSSLVVKQNELTESSRLVDKFSTFYWVNPPHLQSSK